MKIIFVVLASIVSAAAALADEPVGRYQLFNGTLQIGGGGSLTNHAVILKIDTQTGKVWEYFAGTGKDGKFRAFWAETTDGLQEPPK